MTASKNVPAVPEAQPPAIGRWRAPESSAVPMTREMKLAQPGMQLLLEMANDIPYAEEDPTDVMMQAVLAAESAAEMERIFEAESLKEHPGAEVQINTFRLGESTFEEGPGFYLICDVVWLADGEHTVMTAGSLLTMAQLFNFHKRGELPYCFEIIRKDRPTRKGFHPIHLKPLGRPLRQGDGQTAESGE